MTLSMLFLTGCETQPAIKAVAVIPDIAPLASCPPDYPLPPQLKPYQVFTLPDGRAAYLVDEVMANNALVARFVVRGRDAWALCRSTTDYAYDALTGMAPPLDEN